jgi:hypothetical protein
LKSRDFDAEMREDGRGAAQELKEGAQATDAASNADAGTRFTCCTSTSTKIQILTQQAQSARIMQVLDLLALLVQKYKY